MTALLLVLCLPHAAGPVPPRADRPQPARIAASVAADEAIHLSQLNFGIVVGS